MLNLPFLSLILWLPVVFFVFERLPLQKAIVFSFVSAWLFLPPSKIPLPGLPDWGKMTATVVSVLLCTALKQGGNYLRLRPRWFDLPILVYCLCPLASAITANQGAYDGFSAILEEVFNWGIPYLIGRAFLGDASGNRALAYGIAVGGIVYIPICLIEIRMSPQMKMWVYGLYDVGGGNFGLRYGGYRPMGFLSTGLELGWWMCCATFSAYMLWRSKAARKVFNYPLGPLLVVLGLVTVACKATGAIVQIGLGFAIIQLARRTKTSLLFWAILAIPPAYCLARPTGLWTGQSLVSFAEQFFGYERAQSLAFRFDQEEYLMRSALQRPVFGWARAGGFNPPDAMGHTIITDGLWIIVLGTMGSVGLAGLLAMLLVPPMIFLRKVRPQHWLHPDVAPVTTLTIILPLFMIDNLSNAMLNPIYAIAMGSIVSYLERFSAERLGPMDRPGFPARQDLATAYRWDPVGSELFPDEGNGGLAAAAFTNGAYFEAIRHLDDEVEALHKAFRRQPSEFLLERLGQAHAFRARCYSRVKQEERAIEEREYVRGLWTKYAPLLGRKSLVGHPGFAENLNDLAWSLVQARPLDVGSARRAAAYATESVEAYPDSGAFWNTLGVAQYRAGNDLAAIKALSRSVQLSPGHGSLFDFYYLALANHRLGYRSPAQAWLRRAEEAYMARPEGASEVQSVREEARAAVAV